MSESKEIVTQGLGQEQHYRYVFEDGSYFSMISRKGYFDPNQEQQVSSNIGTGMTVKVIPGDSKDEIDGTGGSYPGEGTFPHFGTDTVPGDWVVPIGVEVVNPGQGYEPDEEGTIEQKDDGNRVVGVYKFVFKRPTIDNPIGPSPQGSTYGGGGKFMFYPTAADCKKHLDNTYARRLGENEPDSNFNLGGFGNKTNGYSGWGHLFEADKPNTGRVGGTDALTGRCFQFYTDNLAGANQGVMIGHRFGTQNLYDKARYMNPTGVQFSWSMKHSNEKTNGLALSNLLLMVMEKDDTVLRYVPLVEWFSVVGAYRKDGDHDIMKKYQKQGASGWANFQTSPTYMKRILERRAMCVGILFSFENPYDGTNKAKVMDIYNFKFNFHDLDNFAGPVGSSKSRIIIPGPHSKQDFDAGRIPLV